MAIRLIGPAVAAAFIALLVFGVLKQAPDTTIDDALARSQPVTAPEFDLQVLDRGRVGGAPGHVFARAAGDNRVTLRELRGTPVVLNFWASWCEPCRVEAPVLEAGWRQFRRNGVLFLGIDIQDAREDAGTFLKRFRSTYPHVREGDKRTAQRYGATGLPETFFVSARGRVVGHVIGAISGTQLAAGVRAAETGRPEAARRGGARRETR